MLHLTAKYKNFNFGILISSVRNHCENARQTNWFKIFLFGNSNNIDNKSKLRFLFIKGITKHMLALETHRSIQQTKSNRNTLIMPIEKQTTGSTKGR